jgi:DNA adenine methylase
MKQMNSKTSTYELNKNTKSINITFERCANRVMESVVQYALWSVPENCPRSPLRYPGGKNRAIKFIYSFIPVKETKLCSPFLGGGSIELACTTRMHVYGSDIFSPLIDFWQELINNPKLLADQVERYYPLSRSKFYDLQKSYTYLENKIERAAGFFVLNRSSFSGTTLSGGMSPGHPRFTRSAIERIRSFQVSNFEVECSDFRDTILKYNDAFLYLDPPYVNGQALYGIKGDTHKGFKHQELAEILRNRERWIMSYNDCGIIRDLYCDNPIISLEWVYGMSKNKHSNEVLILSKDLGV